jgi:branched-chain amino acid transport system permease protein
MVNQLLLNGIIAGSIYTLIAVGFSLIYQTTRFFHFAHGAIYTFGAFFAYLFYIQLCFNQIVAFPLACICAASVGVISECDYTDYADYAQMHAKTICGQSVKSA